MGEVTCPTGEVERMAASIDDAIADLDTGDALVVHEPTCPVEYGDEFCKCKPVIVYVQSDRWEN
jgi:hypothetical protein